MFSIIWSKIPSLAKWLALTLLVGIIGFGAGKHLRPSETTTTTATSSTNTLAATNTLATSNTSASTGTTAAKAEVKYVIQRTLKQDKDTDCTEDFDKDTGKLVRRHCITKAHTDVASGNTGSSVNTTSGTSTTTSGTNTVATNTLNTTNTATTTTTTTTKNETKSDWSLSLSASATLYDGKSLAFTPTYGVTAGYNLIGPLSLNLTAQSDKNLIAGVGLSLGKKWFVAAEAGSNISKLSPFYGGTASYRLLGPVWLSAWGYSDKTFGLSASFSVR